MSIRWIFIIMITKKQLIAALPFIEVLCKLDLADEKIMTDLMTLYMEEAMKKANEQIERDMYFY